MWLSVVMPYYRNARMLCRQLLVWRNEWTAGAKAEIEIVIVDDGSPDETAVEALASMWGGDRAGLPPISIYRVTEDRLWHQHGARNLGAHVARGRWLLMTDMDHVVPGSTLAEVLRQLPELGKREVITFGRVDAPRTLTWRAEHWPEFARTRRDDGSLKPHVNSFVVSRDHYWRTGGYDESFCGVYGTDKEFRRRLFVPSTPVRHLDAAPLIGVGREVIDDASTRGIDRKTSGRNALKKAAALRKALAGIKGPVTLNFPWERVAI